MFKAFDRHLHIYPYIHTLPGNWQSIYPPFEPTRSENMGFDQCVKIVDNMFKAFDLYLNIRSVQIICSKPLIFI